MSIDDSDRTERALRGRGKHDPDSRAEVQAVAREAGHGLLSQRIPAQNRQAFFKLPEIDIRERQLVMRIPTRGIVAG